MKARVATIIKRGEIEIRDEEVVSGPEDVVVETICYGLSVGTDMNIYRGIPVKISYGWSPGYPWVISSGETGIGEVIEVGSKVTNLEEGDRVITTGGLRSVGVQKGEETVKIATESDPERACFLHQARVALNAIRRARIVLGDSVLIIGQGAIGLMATQLAKLAGAQVVIAADLYEERLRLAEKMGADLTINPERKDLAEEVRRITDNRGADIVIDVSGSTHTLEPAMQASKYMARIILLSWLTQPIENLVLADDFHFKQLELISCQVEVPFPGDFNHSDHWTAKNNYYYLLTLMEQEKLSVDKIITHRFDLEDTPKIFQALAKDLRAYIGVLIRGSSGKKRRLQ